jgi:Carboxypeptidase regulatory-like domain
MKKLTLQLTACSAILLALVAAVLFSAPQASAQSAFGSVVGTVTDSSGAIVPGANVTITNLGTSEKKSMLTDAAGNYRFVTLLPTQYKVEVEKTSYKKVVQSPITVQVDATARLDVSLTVGATTETVEVTTQAPLLQTESGTLGSQVEGKTVQEMPLNGRNVTNLIALVPGVVPQGASMGNTTMNQGTHTNNAGWGNFQIGGAISGTGSFYLDGAPISTAFGHDVAFIATQDAIQEFKVATNSVSAEFGRFSGGVVEMTTKSGSNSFHGSAYEYHRNTVLNAAVAKIVNNALVTPTTKQKWLQNQYGAAVGGPVLKNKAFFFFSWEKFSSRTGNQDVGNVPDAGMLLAANPTVPGDATHYKDSNGVIQPVVMPTGQANCLTYDSTANRTTIATSCLDATAQVVKNYFAPANQSGVAVGSNNYQYFVPLGDDNQQFNVRGDINLGNHNIFMRYSRLNNSDMSSRDMQDHAGFMTGGAVSYYPTTQAVVGDTITVNPTTIADVRLSYTRAYSDDKPPSAGVDLASKGFTGDWPTINAQQAVKLLPSFAWSGSYNLWQFRGFVVDSRYADISALSYSLTKIKGAHTIKVGGELDSFNVDALPQFQMGTLNISAGNYAHNEWANFLLGDMDNFTFSIPIRTSSYYWYQGYYATDTWNATRKLTLTGGLRWELPGAFGEKHDRGNVLLPDQTAAVNGAPAYGTLALLNTTAYPHRGNELPRKTLLSPRLGVAFRLSDNTVVRAGYALAFVPIDIQQSALPSTSPVNLAPTSTTNTSTTINGTITKPLGGQTINQPTGASDPNFLGKYANTAALQNITAPVPTANKVYTQQWNLTVGQQFKGQQSVEVGYAGMIGIHLLNEGQGGWQLNQISSSLFDSNGVVTSGPYVGQSLTANAPAGACAPAGITRTVGQCLRPHPAYNSLFDGVPAHSTMTYHAMQVRYQKHMGTGMISSGFTWSKSIGDTDTVAFYLNNGNIAGNQDYNNPKGDRSVLSYNISNRWVTSYIVPLPIGKGQKFMNSLNPVVDHIIGGWAVNGIVTLQSGQPLTITQGNGNTLSKNFGAGGIRPNVVAGCSKKASGSAQSRLGKWFNTGCFAPTGNYAMGNESRADPTLKGAGQANWDFTLQKQTKITEATNLAFRVEFFNIFNRRQFGQPTMNVNAGNFGSVGAQANSPRQIQAALRFNF